jgi:hypothetical protein
MIFRLLSFSRLDTENVLYELATIEHRSWMIFKNEYI